MLQSRERSLRHSPLRAKCTKALQCTSAKQRECMSASPRAFPAPRDRVSCSSDSSGTVRCSQPAATRCSFWHLPDRSRWVRLVQFCNAVDSTSMSCLLTRLAVYSSASTYREHVSGVLSVLLWLRAERGLQSPTCASQFVPRSLQCNVDASSQNKALKW